MVVLSDSASRGAGNPFLQDLPEGDKEWVEHTFIQANLTVVH